MKYIFLVVSLISITMIYAYASKTVDCAIQIESVKNSINTYTLVLNHDKECEIIMDHNTSKIVLIPKVYEEESTLISLDSNATNANSKVEKIITLAKSKMGNSYEPGKAGPDHFDCSGFVYYIFKNNGISIPRTSLQQSKSGKKLKREELKRGDILSFDTHDRKHINHSGIYLGEGKFIHSSSGKAYSVTISKLDEGFYKDKFRWGIHKIEE